ncbi:hypothetical protein LX32DRAFT_643553 [Colletotrichum zoysiae]|uniref:Uncharacterized protein n=1 Tax=Colletotrichum zoysiae TaxID=1216348 RepID=A0AAD9LXA3_9PEZI|nr:hypothetical protein LX32DRAFT_643553 [Colletotrichum zoysiae]
MDNRDARQDHPSLHAEANKESDTGRHGRQMPMPGRTTNGIAYPVAMPQVSTTPTPGTRSPSRTTQPPGRNERAQSSRKSHQIHRTDRDPWAIQDRVATQTKLNIGGRL